MSIGDIAQIFALVVAAAIGLSLLAFWVWMLIDCLTRERGEANDRLIWTVVIIFTKIFGAAIYYFVRYRKRGQLQATAASGLLG